MPNQKIKPTQKTRGLFSRLFSAALVCFGKKALKFCEFREKNWIYGFVIECSFGVENYG